MSQNDLIYQYYKYVLIPYIDNYFELEEEINENVNYPLFAMFNIIVHIVKHFILVNMYHIIIKMLVAYLLERAKKLDSKDDTYANFISDTVKNIIEPTYGSSHLMEYMFNVLPNKLVKVILNIYTSENDSDRQENVETLLGHITKILESNTTLPLDKDTSMIKNLTEYIYPFFKDYLELFIKEMKKLIDNHLRNLKHQGIFLEILKILADKAKSEK